MCIILPRDKSITIFLSMVGPSVRLRKREANSKVKHLSSNQMSQCVPAVSHAFRCISEHTQLSGAVAPIYWHSHDTTLAGANALPSMVLSHAQRCKSSTQRENPRHKRREHALLSFRSGTTIWEHHDALDSIFKPLSSFQHLIS